MRALEVVELLARRHRLLLRAGPVAAQPHDLGAVDPARAGEAGDVEPVAPAVRHLRPLGGTAVVAEVLAGADRDAVDEPGRVRPQLAADRRRGRLVEQREPVLDLAGLDERAALSDEREHLRVAVAEALAELVRPAEVRERPRRPPAEHRGDSHAMSARNPCSAASGCPSSSRSALANQPLRDGERAAAGVIPDSVSAMRAAAGLSPAAV